MTTLRGDLRTWAVLLCSFLAFPAIAYSQSYFKPAVSLAAGLFPDFIATGDFNHDGVSDIAACNAGSGNVSILLGNSDGTFRPAVNYPVSGTPKAIAVGDFNGDGSPDLVVLGIGSPANINILLGNIDGTFKPAISMPMPTSSMTIVTVGDFNRDGKLDLVVGDSTDSYFAILLGNGDGTFQAPTFINHSGPIPISVVAGDFNGDGKLDLALATYFFTSSFEVLLGNGDGTFTQSQFTFFPRSGAFFSLLTADFNGDGKPDLALANFALSGDVEVMLGNGDGTFQPPQAYPIANARAVVAGDFNHDGKLDLAASGDNQVSILWGNGNGTFRVDPVTYPVSPVPVSIVTGNFNNDHRLDLAVGTNETVDLLINDAPDFNIAAAPNSITVKAGQTATAQLTITPLGNLNSPISLSCAGLPASVNCVFSPATPMPNGAPVSIVLQITTSIMAELHDSGQSKQSKPLFASAYAVMSLGLMGLVLSGSWSKRPKVVRNSLIVALVFLVGLEMSGCGGALRDPLPLSNSATTNSATTTLAAPGTSQIMVIGQTTSGGITIQEKTPITVTITQ